MEVLQTFGRDIAISILLAVAVIVGSLLFMLYLDKKGSSNSEMDANRDLSYLDWLKQEELRLVIEIDELESFAMSSRCKHYDSPHVWRDIDIAETELQKIRCWIECEEEKYEELDYLHESDMP